VITLTDDRRAHNPDVAGVDLPPLLSYFGDAGDGEAAASI
jgi:hypothetical protein